MTELVLIFWIIESLIVRVVAGRMCGLTGSVLAGLEVEYQQFKIHNSYMQPYVYSALTEALPLFY